MRAISMLLLVVSACTSSSPPAVQHAEPPSGSAASATGSGSAADADELEHLMRSADASAQQWFQSTYSPQLSAANQMAWKKAKECQGDPDFKAAFAEVSASPSHQP